MRNWDTDGDDEEHACALRWNLLEKGGEIDELGCGIHGREEEGVEGV